MFTRQKTLLAALILALGGLVIQCGIAAELVYPDRNLPVDPNFKDQGDQKYGDEYYRNTSIAPREDGLLNTPDSALGPYRNLPVDNDFKSQGDRKYDPADYAAPSMRSGSSAPVPGMRTPERNLPVSNNHKDQGDPKYRDFF